MASESHRAKPEVGSSRVLDPSEAVYFFFNVFLERGGEGKREGEKYQCVVASCTPPTGDLARNPGMCPDWELNR